MNADQRAQVRDKAMRKTSVVGAIVNLALTVLKIIFGIIGQSQALIADGIHSLADLSTDLMVWLAAKYSNRPADKDHPYGHARIETAFTVGLGVVLIVTAIGIVIDSGQRLLNPETLLQPTPIVLLIAAINKTIGVGCNRVSGFSKRCPESITMPIAVTISTTPNPTVKAVSMRACP